MTDRKKRFYAVVQGRRPGIYTEWDGFAGARVQVSGFAGAVFKGFSSLEEARRFMGAARTPLHGRGQVVTARNPDAGPVPDAGSIHVYTDGGCISNPGPGGWAAVIIDRTGRRELSGGVRYTTNNRMELKACIMALKSLDKGATVSLFTDSQYVANAVEKGWARKWRSRNWMRDKSHRAENPDLWAELLDLVEERRVRFHWVRGHAGNPENERCDELARSAAQRKDLPVDPGYERQPRGADGRLF
jgi:ribonuclease HI